MPQIIRPATLADKQKVLEILDEFNDFALITDGNVNSVPSSFAIKNSGDMFEEIINSDNSKIFIALVDEELVGFLEIHAVPRLRKAKRYAEIESMFVKEASRGTGIASDLMQAAIEWAKKQEFDCIRIYTGHKLKRAHAFYEKMGFAHAGRSYKHSLI